MSLLALLVCLQRSNITRYPNIVSCIAILLLHTMMPDSCSAGSNLLAVCYIQHAVALAVSAACSPVGCLQMVKKPSLNQMILVVCDSSSSKGQIYRSCRR